MAAASEIGCVYNENALIYNKIEQLNATACNGRTDWTYPEVYASIMYNYGSVREWFEFNAQQEGVCPFGSNTCCASAGYSHYKNWDAPLPQQGFTRYFIHGAGCKADNCNVYTRLQQELPGLTSIGYHSHDTYQNTRALLLSQIAGAGSNSLFIGESLGGFWAAQLAKHFGAYCYLLNPVTDVPSQMAQFVGRSLQEGMPAITQANLNTYSAAPDPRPSMSLKVGLMLSGSDTTIDADTTVAYYRGIAPFVDWCDDGHAISNDASFKTIKLRALLW